MSTPSFGFAELLLAGRMRQSGCAETWTFEISLAALPTRRSFLIAAGLEQAIGMLERLAQDGPDFSDLDPGRLPAPLDPSILQRVGSLRFTGNVEAVPEGTVIFSGEPVMRLRAPAPEAVLLGTALVGVLRSQTAVATKAARLVLAAGGKPVYEVGMRSGVREAALHAARSAHVGGASASSNAIAAMEFGLPTLPVIPISLVAALGGVVSGLEACGVLIDGALANEGDAALAALSVAPRAIIIDAGTRNLAARVPAMRAGIQSLGWKSTKILVGGRLDEDGIDAMTHTGVEVDGFCVGGELVVASDSPCVGFDYELVERELDGHRIPLPRRDGGVGRRTVWRRREAGKFRCDTIQAESKPPPPGGMPLLVRVMEKGRRLFRAPSLAEVRVLCGSQLSMLDPAVTRRVDPEIYSVVNVVEPKPQDAAAAAAAAAAREPVKPAPKAKAESTRPEDARRRALAQIDDSTDFSAVSGAFESVVAQQFSVNSQSNDEGDETDAVEPPADEMAAEDAAPPEALSSEESPSDDAPAEALDPDPVVYEEPPAEAAAEDASSGDDDSAELPVDDEPVAAEADESTELPVDDGIIEIIPSRAPRAVDPPKRATPPKSVVPPAPPPPAPKPAAPALDPLQTLESFESMPTFGNPPEPRHEARRPVAHESSGPAPANPLLAAAARLRSMQRGEPLTSARAAPAEGASSSRPDAATAEKKAPATDSPADPLLAAAARLKSLRRN